MKQHGRNHKVIFYKYALNLVYYASRKNLESYCEDDPAATSPLLIYDGEEMRDFGEHKVSIRNWRDGFCLERKGRKDLNHEIH